MNYDCENHQWIITGLNKACPWCRINDLERQLTEARRDRERLMRWAVSMMRLIDDDWDMPLSAAFACAGADEIRPILRAAIDDAGGEG